VEEGRDGCEERAFGNAPFPVMKRYKHEVIDRWDGQVGCLIESTCVQIAILLSIQSSSDPLHNIFYLINIHRKERYSKTTKGVLSYSTWAFSDEI